LSFCRTPCGGFPRAVKPSSVAKAGVDSRRKGQEEHGGHEGALRAIIALARSFASFVSFVLFVLNVFGFSWVPAFAGMSGIGT
jgi:hypothetical protein